MYPRKGDFIKHNMNMDICFEVVKPVIFLNDKSMVIKTKTWNMAFVNSFHIGYHVMKEFRIHVEDHENWKVLAPPFPDCLRYGDWRNMGASLPASNPTAEA